MSFDADIIVVGAGPAGLAFSRTLAHSPVSVLILEKQPEEFVSTPAFDGREIAITHASRQSMQQLGIWNHLPEDQIYLLKEAKVLNGKSDYSLHFFDKNPRIPGEGLGFLIPNYLIRQASYNAVKDQSNLRIRYGVGVKDVNVTAQGATVILDNGEKITARMVIAADSRFSNTRRQMGIGAEMNDFGRTVHVFRMRHTTSNEHTALECFHYGRTLAILPLEENLSSCVVTIDTHRSHEITDLSPEQLEQSIMNQLEDRLGDMKLDGKIVSYPLVGVHAKRFYGLSCAVIGDAAVGMHPVTAQGYNLGLQSAVILGGLIAEAASQGQDIASPALLSKYERKHMLNTRPIYHGTNFVVTLFTTEHAPAKLLRSVVMRFSNNFPPIKYLITRQLTKLS
ncbi:5-demethoxyubiquinol-8 5-hydroxylase UbiM [Pelistega europaea]|uniref:5-demethoxyubiquinol-8 5-hydroxylase UbiM n=1 Tax=Pelistega europaea TaxID=106147 RepID=A0A7Y4P6V6_9BURK|nr:5-demethoxyubiquinol-8 5-hydroxylase UbiM [Pelistega europaea]NOL50309.1 5-demethoxyubiquinol-8 5-hydroxylase UbiM [Pelistega europaea]